MNQKGAFHSLFNCDLLDGQIAIQPGVGGTNLLRKLVHDFQHIDLVAGVATFTVARRTTGTDCSHGFNSFVFGHSTTSKCFPA